MRRQVAKLALLAFGFGSLAAWSDATPRSESAKNAPPRAQVQVLVTSTGSEKLPQGIVRLAPISGDYESFEVPLATTIETPLPVGTGWRIAADAPGFWSEETLLLVRSGEALTATLKLWPTSTVTGRLKLKKADASQHGTLTLDLKPPPIGSFPKQPATAQIECSVEKSGTFVCEPPLGVFDVALRFNGFAPHYLWGLRIGDDEVPLGKVPLKRGSSVSGWVESANRSADLTKTSITFERQLSRSVGGTAAARLRNSRIDARVDERGFFHAVGIPPGRYAVDFSHPDFAPVRVSSVEVVLDQETTLRNAVYLAPPVTLEIAVDPPLDPNGKPWLLRVSRTKSLGSTRAGTPFFDGEVPETGLVEIPGQAPGEFSLILTTGDGDRYAGRWNVELGGEAPSFHQLTVEWVPIEGQLSLGDEPLPGTLWFGTRGGVPSAEIKTDEEGHFEGILPKAGRWRVEIASEEPRIETKLRVEIEEPEDSGEPVWVAISIPDTEVFGQVVMPNGSEAPEARVWIETTGSSLQTVADETGAFSIRGVPEATASISAQMQTDGKTLLSIPVYRPVAEDAPVGPVELRLEDLREFKGQVVSADGPIPGASVLIAPDTAVGIKEVLTDTEGRFSVQFPRAARSVTVAVAAPGFALKAFSVGLDGTDPIFLVTQDGGVVEIAPEQTLEEYQDQRHTFLLFQDGVLVHSTYAMQWALTNGEQLNSRQLVFRIPALAPGSYTACVGPRDVIPIWQLDQWVADASCDQGELGSGGMLRLEP